MATRCWVAIASRNTYSTSSSSFSLGPGRIASPSACAIASISASPSPLPVADAGQGGELVGQLPQGHGAVMHAGMPHAVARPGRIRRLLGREAQQRPQGAGFEPPVAPPVAALHLLQRPEGGLDRIPHPLPPSGG